MKRIAVSPTIALVTVLALTACQASGDELRSNVYTADQVNSHQDVVFADILVLAPAKLNIDNTRQKQTAQVVGGLLGAVGGGLLGSRLGGGNLLGTSVGVVGGGAAGAGAGSLVADKVLVDAVSITYRTKDGHMSNSAQVGELCEYKLGNAVLVSMSPSETRIQPNTTCPVLKKT